MHVKTLNIQLILPCKIETKLVNDIQSSSMSLNNV